MQQVRQIERAKGRRDGFSIGYKHGYRLGTAEAVVSQIPMMPPKLSPLRILYIPQGFEAIDHGCSIALSKMSSAYAEAHPSRLVDEAQRFKPDLIVVLNALHVFPQEHPEHIIWAKQQGIKTAIWFVDDPYFTQDTAVLAPYYDFVFTHEQQCVPFYKQLGCRHVYHLPLAAATERFRPIRSDYRYCHDICFIGNGFWNRVAFFDSYADQLMKYDICIAGGYWDRMVSHARWGKRLRSGWVPLEESVYYYNSSKIILNIHRPHEQGADNRNTFDLPAQSINPRTYEIAACGAFQLTDVRSDLAQMYTPGWDIETFQTGEELMQKIEYYLHHEEERMRIAMRSLQTTFMRHTFEHRVHHMLDIIEKGYSVSVPSVALLN
ncbi:CgeB family protein [Paenibacillus assamensis]|uniref:CgeB family protein n=1 Tax=Paenibacillus assamensis TaxID=311244 RepID=UPI00041361D9|nr:DUF3880 domain-containing protein [Paenibacillus assamensis]